MEIQFVKQMTYYFLNTGLLCPRVSDCVLLMIAYELTSMYLTVRLNVFLGLHFVLIGIENSGYKLALAKTFTTLLL